jgi:hypothetical protein
MEDYSLIEGFGNPSLLGFGARHPLENTNFFKAKGKEEHLKATAFPPNGMGLITETEGHPMWRKVKGEGSCGGRWKVNGRERMS